MVYNRVVEKAPFKVLSMGIIPYRIVYERVYERSRTAVYRPIAFGLLLPPSAYVVPAAAVGVADRADRVVACCKCTRRRKHPCGSLHLKPCTGSPTTRPNTAPSSMRRLIGPPPPPPPFHPLPPLLAPVAASIATSDPCSSRYTAPLFPSGTGANVPPQGNCRKRKRKGLG